jgi:hypothetical protein
VGPSCAGVDSVAAANVTRFLATLDAAAGLRSLRCSDTGFIACCARATNAATIRLIEYASTKSRLSRGRLQPHWERDNPEPKDRKLQFVIAPQLVGGYKRELELPDDADQQGRGGAKAFPAAKDTD